MKRSLFLSILLLSLVSSCTEKSDPTEASDWLPENASVARHITKAHGFAITPEESAHLRVEMTPEGVVTTLREDVLETLGGEKVLFILGWEANPQLQERHEYLYFLEALHAYLVMNAPKWDGGEGKGKS